MRDILYRHRFVLLFFILMGVIDVFHSRNLWAIGATAAAILVTAGIETAFYSRRGVYLFAQIGFIAGYCCGVIAWKMILFVYPSIPVNFELYLIACFGYLGFYMPLMAVQKKTGAVLQAPYSDSSVIDPLDLKLLDTSVIIDGRVNDLAATGFLHGTLIVPKFVLNEIQALADSQDPIKRSRARRGLDVLNMLKEQKHITLKVTAADYKDIKGVDSKLIALAKEKDYSIFTNDYNLNKIATIEGVSVLNINDLVNALKPVLLPGEQFELDVLRAGKEQGQGVGYLDDGTMVVLANGANMVGRKLLVAVTSTLQTSAGRIIFTEAVK